MLSMLKGLRTVIYRVDDIEKAKSWYMGFLGIAPYFDEPYYVGFNVGGFELGLDPDYSGAVIGNTEVAYWGVDDIEEAYRKARELGAETMEDILDVGEGIRVVTVKDPSGNILGIIENPHFKIEE